MGALSQMIEATVPGGLILDLQVIRPDPYVELDGKVIARIDGGPLFAWADAAMAAVEARLRLATWSRRRSTTTTYASTTPTAPTSSRTSRDRSAAFQRRWCRC